MLFVNSMEKKLWTNLSIPDSAFSYVPFTIERNGSTFRPKNWDVSSLAPTGKTYYFSSSGNDSNDGLTLATAKRNLYSCPADAVVVYLTAGHWGWTYNFRGAYPGTLMAVIGIGSVDYTNDLEYYSGWTADGNCYKYTTTRAIGDVWDALNLDANGHYSKLTLVANAATVNTTPGSWYKDGSNVLWVRTTDSRAPDSNIRVIIGGTVGLKPGGATPYYFENINFKLNSGTGRIFRAFGNGDAASKLYAKNCSVSYDSTSTKYDLWDIDGIGTIILQGCYAEKGQLDGFNYHAQSGVIPRVIEINCSGRWCGVTGDNIDNGSTIHDAATIVRIGGEYYKTNGPTIADVNNCRSWNLGVYARDSLAASGTSVANFFVSNTPDGSIQWLDSCRSTGSTYDIVNVTNTTTYSRSFSGAAINSIGGTLSTY